MKRATASLKEKKRLDAWKGKFRMTYGKVRFERLDAWKGDARGSLGTVRLIPGLDLE